MRRKESWEKKEKGRMCVCGQRSEGSKGVSEKTEEQVTVRTVRGFGLGTSESPI